MGRAVAEKTPLNACSLLSEGCWYVGDLRMDVGVC